MNIRWEFESTQIGYRITVSIGAKRRSFSGVGRYYSLQTIEAVYRDSLRSGFMHRELSAYAAAKQFAAMYGG